MKLLVRLQSKPYHTRLVIMWLAVFVCMSIIIGLWFWSFNRSVKLANQESEKQESEVSSQLKELKEEIPSLWQSLGAGIKSLFEKGPEGTFREDEKNEESLEINEVKPAQLPDIP